MTKIKISSFAAEMFKKFQLPLKIAISGIILWVLVSRMNMGSLENYLHELSWSAWLWATALILLQAVLISIRWAGLINIDKPNISILESIRITALSSIANLLFITSVGGVVVRVALAVKQGLRMSKAIMSTFIDRLFTLLGLLIITACFFTFLQPYVPQDVYKTTGMLIIGLIACGFLAIPLLFRAPYNNKLFTNRRIAPVAAYTRDVLSNPWVMSKATLLSVLAQLAYLFSSYVIIAASGIDIPLLATIGLLPILALISSLPIGYGGWGIREGTFVYGLSFIGIPFEQAFLISIQIGIIGILSTIILGFVVLITTEDFKVETYKSFLLKKSI